MEERRKLLPDESNKPRATGRNIGSLTGCPGVGGTSCLRNLTCKWLPKDQEGQQHWTDYTPELQRERTTIRIVRRCNFDLRGPSLRVPDYRYIYKHYKFCMEEDSIWSKIAMNNIVRS